MFLLPVLVALKDLNPIDTAQETHLSVFFFLNVGI
jgi:hypothetical protein